LIFRRSYRRKLNLRASCDDIPIILSLGRWRQGDYKFDASLGCISSQGNPEPHSKTLSQTNKQTNKKE
jgi:hypothetical protein